MPAKGSCCCVTPQLATMWKVNVFTGEVVEALSYDRPNPLLTYISSMCGIDAYDAVEFPLAGTPDNTRLWSKDGDLIWGPLSDRADDGFRGWANLLESHIVYGGAFTTQNSAADSWTSTGGALRVLERSDGDQTSHSMAGKLIHAQDDYVDTFEEPTAPATIGTIRRYEASDFSTVRASQTRGLAVTADVRSVAFSQASYAMMGATVLKVVDPSDLSTRFEVNPIGVSVNAVAVDEEGGVYVDAVVATARIIRYSTSTTPDWDVTDANFPPLRFGALGNAYGLNSVVREVTKIDGTDGSIAWECDFSAFAANVTGQFGDARVTGHSGMLLLPCGAQGLVAIDDDYGTVAWYSANKGYGKPIPDGDDYVWCCGEYGT